MRVWGLLIVIAACEPPGAALHAGADASSPVVDDGTTSDAPTACVPSAWAFTPLTSDEAGTGAFQVDESGILHVAYWAYPSLQYASRAPGDVAWTTESLGVATSSPSMVRDASGGVHLVYQVQSEHALEYAYRAPAGGWTRETIDDDGISVASTSISPFALQVDAQGGVYVAYWTFPGYELKYARRVGVDQWELEDVSSEPVINDVSLALDANDNAHLIYYASNQGHMKYADQTATGWDIGDIAVGGEISDLIVDPSGTLHALFGDHFGFPTYAIRLPGGQWQPPEDLMFMSGRYSNGVVTPHGVYIVSYFSSHGIMWLTHRDLAGQWSSEPINNPDDNMPRGKIPSIAVDATGGIHVLFADLFNGREYYAYRCL